MAIRAVSTTTRAGAYAAATRPTPKPPPDGVTRVPPTLPTREALRRSEAPQPPGAPPYVNAEGQTTGTIVNTTA